MSHVLPDDCDVASARGSAACVQAVDGTAESSGQDRSAALDLPSIG